MMFVSKATLLSTVIAIFALAGCSGGGAVGGIGFGEDGAAGASSDATIRVDAEGLYALNTEMMQLAARHQGSRQAYDHSVDLSFGRATYNGIVAFKPKGGFGDHSGPPGRGILDVSPLRNPEMIADAAMTVDFTQGKLSGSLWNFHDSTGAVAEGSVQMTGRQNLPSERNPGVITQDQWRVDGSGSGTLYWGDRTENIIVDMTGELYRSSSSRIADGLFADLAVTRIGTDGETQMDGRLLSENDKVPNPIQQ